MKQPQHISLDQLLKSSTTIESRTINEFVTEFTLRMIVIKNPQELSPDRLVIEKNGFVQLVSAYCLDLNKKPLKRLGLLGNRELRASFNEIVAFAKQLSQES